MDQPEKMGTTRKDLLSSLAKITYHIRQERNEERHFDAWRPTKISCRIPRIPPDQRIEHERTGHQEHDEFTRRSIVTRDVKEWVRKREAKLVAKEVEI